ncbi:MAG TPA: hypothetical protein VNX01_04860 [Bacteroidia bacterium]|jgi:hypothetical protein|nr:hypothetical protein [Bacteroidia bacterium]
MTINEENIPYTFKEKFFDSPLMLVVLIPIAIATLLLLPFLLALGLVYENVLEKLYYKLTGKQRKTFIPKNPYSGLSIDVDFQYIYLIDNYINNLIEKYNLSEDDFRDMEIGKIETIPSIDNLSNRYFDHNTIVFQDKLFVQEVKLPDFNTSLGYIDCKNLTYHTITDFDYYPRISFNNTNNALDIIIRLREAKKLIRIT